MSFYKVYSPTANLTGLIRELQVYHANWNLEEHLPSPFITCLANTEQNLYFFINDPVHVIPAENIKIPSPSVIVTGPKIKPVGLLFGRDHLMIKIAFYPTGMYRLLGITMEQTVNKGLDAADFWGTEVTDIVQLLRKAVSYDSMIEIISSFIDRKFDNACRPEEPIDNIAIRMLDPQTDHTLEQWASLACLSLRQFERNFVTRVGISPKLFIRITRFEYAMKVKNESPDKSWAGIALECGYTDSSHLLKEFKEFAEFPPGRFYLKQTSGNSEFPTA